MIRFINFSEQPFIQRPAEVCQQLKVGCSTFYNRINEGLFPPPFSIGDRAVAFYSYETNAVIRALAAGCKKEEIKKLIELLIQFRNSPQKFCKVRARRCVMRNLLNFIDNNKIIIRYKAFDKSKLKQVVELVVNGVINNDK